MRFRQLKFSAYLSLIIFLLLNCSGPDSIKRPKEMWAFRSVMDENPRMLTAALHKNLWVSFDVQKGVLYKAWKGEVNFDGAVYTTVHGPQPTSQGYAFIHSPSEFWVVDHSSGIVKADYSYKGHDIIDNKLLLRHELTVNEKTLEIVEYPEYVGRGNQKGLVREFTILNKTTERIGLKTSVQSLQSLNDLIASESWKTESVDTTWYGDAYTLNVHGILWLSQKETKLKIYFHPGFDDLAREIKSEDQSLEVSSGAKLIAQSDCEACHNEKVKTIGPSYLSVARKYGDGEASIELLAGKIISGGSGVWGDVMMTPHPTLSFGDASEMVKYILSLDDNEGDKTFNQFSLGEKSIPIRLPQKANQLEGRGFMANLYLIQEIPSDLKNFTQNIKPIKQGAISRIHCLETSDFDPQEEYAIRFSGILEIPKDGTYGFRVFSDDGSALYIDGKEVINHGGLHGPSPKDGELGLSKGDHTIELVFFQWQGGGAVSLQWFDREKETYVILDDKNVRYDSRDVIETSPYVSPEKLVKSIPGDKKWLEDVHPAFDLFQARPDNFQPRVGGIDFLPTGEMIVCTWDSLGPVYKVNNWQSGKPDQMTVTRIAQGLAEPLGLKVVEGEIYVLQKQELTRLLDLDSDGIMDRYETVTDQWKVSANFHEFAFGLVYQEGFFYATLATAIMPGGASANPQIIDRGKVVKINKTNGNVEFIAKGLRTPNGIGVGVDNQLFVADNQGDWLPASKIVHVKNGAFYGQRSVDPDAMALTETLPLVWLPQDEIGNSPSTPLFLDKGPYAGQMMHGEVTHGGLKRVFVEKVNGNYQGAVFRFTQGLEAGINRIAWAPDGSLVVGGIGVSGNWGQTGKLGYGLQRLVYNDKVPFEMLEVSAKTDGFVVTFTEAIGEGQYVTEEDFEIWQWYYKPTAEYGGPKLGLEKLDIEAFSLTNDRKSIHFKLKGLQENHVVYFRIVRPFISTTQKSLWSTEAWYTLNELPLNQPVMISNEKEEHNTLSEKEVSLGWKLLFDGKTTGHFKNFKKETIGANWKVQNGNLIFSGKGKESGWQSQQGGDIVITDRPYSNFELYLEWKISRGGNSGIIYRVSEEEAYEYAWQSGPEMQILDNLRHPDGQIDKHRAGDLYDMISCPFVTASGPDEWQRIRLIIRDNKVEHWQNGYKLVEYIWGDASWKAFIAGSKFKDMVGFGTYDEGHIVLQDHGDAIAFRNIKIKPL